MNALSKDFTNRLIKLVLKYAKKRHVVKNPFLIQIPLFYQCRSTGMSVWDNIKDKNKL